MNHPDSYAWHPLSNEQKARLSILAREAFDKLKVARASSSSAHIDDWRREESIKCCGRRISEASQRDFLPLKAHFLDLAGESGRALNVLMKQETEPTRVAMHKLRTECAARKLSLSYPEAICRRQYHCGLAQASAKQLWCLVFTIRNRRQAEKGPPKSAKEKTTANCPF